MNGREAQRIAEFGLRDRQGTAVVSRKTDRLQLHVHLAEQVRDPTKSRLPADSRHPLAEDGCVDQRVAPEQCPDTREAHCQIHHSIVRNEDHCGLGYRREAVIHGVQVQALQIGSIAGDVE